MKKIKYSKGFMNELNYVGDYEISKETKDEYNRVKNLYENNNLKQIKEFNSLTRKVIYANDCIAFSDVLREETMAIKIDDIINITIENIDLRTYNCELVIECDNIIYSIITNLKGE